MHPGTLSGGVAEFDIAVEAGVCPYLNQLGGVAIGEMRSVYEQLDAGDYSALGQLAEQLATAIEQKAPIPEPKLEQKQPERYEPAFVGQPNVAETKPEIVPEHTTPGHNVEPAHTLAVHATPAKPHIEQTQAATETHAPSPSEKATPAQETITSEPAYAPLRPDEPLGAMLDVPLPTPDYEVPYNLETEYTVVPDVLSRNDTPPDISSAKLLVGGPVIRPVDVVPEETSRLVRVAPELAPNEILSQSDTPAVLEPSLSETGIPAVVTLSEHVFAVEVPADLDELEPTELLRETAQETEPLPAVAVSVAERLAELKTDEKEAITPLLQEIVQKVQILSELPAAKTEPEVAEAVQAELEELVAILFEELGIAYQPEDCRRFVTVLLRPDFQPPQSEVLPAVDLEYDGTHEAKLHFSQLISGSLAEVEETVDRLLGKMVLSHAMRRTLPAYELAALGTYLDGVHALITSVR